LPNEVDRERFLKLPFTGCDGLPKTGQAWVRSGLLAATVFVPPNTGQAIEMFVQAIQQKKRPPERVLTVPTSIPQLGVLKPLRMT
jgi:ribose transport system substrate-binding protein